MSTLKSSHWLIAHGSSLVEELLLSEVVPFMVPLEEVSSIEQNSYSIVILVMALPTIRATTGKVPVCVWRGGIDVVRGGVCGGEG